jgi:DSF synthase
MILSTRPVENVAPHGDNDNVPPLGRHRLHLRAANPAAGLDLEFECLHTQLETETGILWARMRHADRACYTPGLMQDMRALQRLLRERFGGCDEAGLPFRWLVWTSDAPNVWSLGGDLTSFVRLIRSRDASGLRDYAHLAIDILYDNHIALDLPIATAALVQGDAVGGGVEAMLTQDVVIAERGTKFGMPEILFNLFPGMGGYSFLSRRLGERAARSLIEDGLSHSADGMATLGLIDIVCEAGRGESTLRRYIADQEPRRAAMRTLKRVRQRVNPITRQELLDVVDMWVELALAAGPLELKRMECLARVQQKRRCKTPAGQL